MYTKELPFQKGTENGKCFFVCRKFSSIFQSQLNNLTNIGCIPPACQLYELQPPDVSTGGGGPQMNKFEDVSGDSHQISLAVGEAGVPCQMFEGGTEAGGGAMSDGLMSGGREALYSEFQYQG